MGFSSWGYAASQGFVFAIEEINRDVYLLPNLTLGFSIWDSGDSIAGAFLGTMDFLTGQGKPVPNYSCRARPPPTALIGELRSALSMPLARWLGLYKFPQISYGSSIISLSDKTNFPSFLRTVPNDKAWVQSTAILLNHFGWIWVGIVFHDDDFGHEGSSLMTDELEKFGICWEFLIDIPTFQFPERFHQVLFMFQKSTAKVIIAILSSWTFINFLDFFSLSDISGKIWIRSDVQWDEKMGHNLDVPQIISISSPQPTAQGFPKFVSHMDPNRASEDVFLKIFWENVFNCTWQDQNPISLGNRRETGREQFCTGSEHLQDKYGTALNVEKLSIKYDAYKAVYSIAHALQDLSSCEVGKGPIGNRMCPDVNTVRPWQLLQYIRKVHFQTPQKSEVFFDANGDLPSGYGIRNVQKNSEGFFDLVNVGYVDSTAPRGKEIIVNVSAIQWKGGKTQVPQSVCSESCLPGSIQVSAKRWLHCCFDCEPCPEGQFADHTDMQQCAECPEDQYPNTHRDGCLPKVLTFLGYEEPLGMTLSCLALALSLLTVIIFLIFVKHRDTPIVKSNNRALSYTLLISLTFCFLCSLLFIGRPTTASCLLRQMTFGITFTVAISSVLAKTIIVVLAFKATRPGSWLKRWASTRVSSAVVLICCLIQVTLCVIWIATSPPFLDVVTDFEPGHILILCNEGSMTTFYCVLGYMGFLALGSFTVAFLARNLPDTFNEAKLITFSMLVFCSVWVSFLPAYQSTKGKAMVAVEIFAILASSAGLLVCIFIPKCYVILWRPHQNTLESIKPSHSSGQKVSSHTKSYLPRGGGDLNEDWGPGANSVRSGCNFLSNGYVSLQPNAILPKASSRGDNQQGSDTSSSYLTLIASGFLRSPQLLPFYPAQGDDGIFQYSALPLEMKKSLAQCLHLANAG
ncbi:vomeronasal type-2 receptor 26-like [Dromiciops gliroides]|uniref:vomeronasal type-2 receptor 26-like n=1 Tax=Dromiciops gliroides TaxID=33562 RepID=UPI001CC59327|nr:vomeronasal type-2 receptor 26-like [Dromiciops gliroides]